MSTPEIVIRPRAAWLRLDLKELADFRDLMWLLVRRDFVAKYKQTILGPAWFVLQPLMTTLVFTLLFSGVLGIKTGNVPPILFYLCGQLAWNYFGQTLNGTGNTFTHNAHLFSKVYFPRLVVPLAVSISNLVAFGVQLGLFLVVYAWYAVTQPAAIQPSWLIVTLPLVLVQTGLTAFGVGLWIAGLTAKYRDFAHLLGFLTQLWMYGTPVIYPLSTLLEKLPPHWQWLAYVNPMTAPVETFKAAFLGAGTVTPTLVLVSVAISVVVGVTGLFYFQRVERSFVDTA